MANKYTQYLIDGLERLVDEYVGDPKVLKQIDDTLSRRKVRKRNTDLREKIKGLLANGETKKPKTAHSPKLAVDTLTRKPQVRVKPNARVISAQVESTNEPSAPLSSKSTAKPGSPRMPTDSTVLPTAKKKRAPVIYPEGFMKSSFEKMREKLLDSSGANSRLLHLDQRRKGLVRVVDELPDQLAEALLKDRAMAVIPVPEPTKDELIRHGYLEWDEEELRFERLKNDPSAREWAGILGLINNYELPSDSNHTDDDRHTDLDLQTLLFESQLNVALKKLASEAKTAIEETGNNILFLSLGFLEWVDAAEGGRSRLAPLYMIPVRVVKLTIKGVAVYKISYSGEDIIPNLTLRERFKNNFDIVLPGILNQEGERLSPEVYFSEVEALLARKKNDPIVNQWRIRRYGTLATMSLGKLLMYLDLDPELWPEGEGNLLQHDVVKRFFSDGERQSNSAGEQHEPYVLDNVRGIHEQFPMIEDADSSQMSVLIDVLKGESMVVEGPPGTGKSQTITNLIAAAIAAGKSVLFIAEKQAALDVVKRRMDKAGLGDFCLDLHSDKAQKRLVLDSIKDRMVNSDNFKYSDVDYGVQVARYENAREELQSYALMVNKQWKSTGLTIHEILSAATRYAQMVAPLKYKDIAPEGVSGDHFNRIQLDEQLEKLRGFYDYLTIVSKQLNDIGNWLSHPWYGVENKRLGHNAEAVVDQLKEWNEALKDLRESLLDSCVELGIDTEIYSDLPAIEALVVSWLQLPLLSGQEHISAFALLETGDLDILAQGIGLHQQIAKHYASARKVFTAELVENLSHLSELEESVAGLQKLGVESSTDFVELVKGVSLLESCATQFRQLNKQRSELLFHLPSDLKALLPSTQAGCHELAGLITHAGAIPAKYLRYREDVFDNEELIEVLQPFKSELTSLLDERDRLAKVFDLTKLPASESLQVWTEALAKTSLFSWFSGAWRQAKKSVQNLVLQPEFDGRAISEELAALTKWRNAANQFEQSPSYKNLLGTQFEGLATDFQRVEALFLWYRQIRKDYGIGFGSRVPLAKFLFSAPLDVMLGIQGLYESRLGNELHDFVANLKSLAQVFQAEACFSADDLPYDVDPNPLYGLLFKIKEHLKGAQGYLLNPNLPQSELLSAVASLKSLTQASDQLEQLQLNERFFNNELALQPNTKGGLPADLAIIQATHHFMGTLYKVDNLDLQSVIRKAPSMEAVSCIIDKAAGFGNLQSALEEKESAFMRQVETTREAWFSYQGLQLDSVEARNKRAIDNGVWLDSWVKYLYAKERMESGGFAKLKQYLMSTDCTLEYAQTVMRFATFRCLADEVYSQQAGLAEKSGHEQTSLQQRFARNDEDLKNIQRQRVASLAADRKAPEGTQGARVTSFTGATLLHHEIKKKTRHISVRNLVKRAGDAMQAYKPCFMMSPMAVAKYIPPGSLKFDLVIMDEASQVKPEYALSSFARGSQVVVVGDPKQLPPTSFFDRTVSNDEFEEDDGAVIEDAESILDAIGGHFTNRQLRWHYRSRHESLIDFSNHRFYDSNLVVFPSPWNDSDEYGIKFNYVEDGRFLKSVNIPESHRVVASIREHLINSPAESLGVVAMNAKQKEQIEADLEAAVASDGVLKAAYFKNLETEDPLFVKNLENVQGDERDVIFISFTYGPQEKGSKHVPLRFGPINGPHGWRRLNVLFTRSKKRIQVYSSMKSEQLPLNESTGRGMRSLKEYLQYAETGKLQGSIGQETGREPDSDFEVAVIDALSREGFECVPQVGVAGFFIDLAVRDPGMPGRYLMGIECDGATYHSSKSTRDRDRVRQGVLEGLDWRIRRIWSTDWFTNPQGELKPIIDELKALATPISEVPIETIEPEADQESVNVEEYLSTTASSLEERLLDFSVNVIEKELPNTEPEKRLLRTDMLERFVTERPTTLEDFTVFIPGYLRTHTCSKEAGRFLNEVLEIIADDDWLTEQANQKEKTELGV